MTKRKALVVDDDPHTRTLVYDALTMLGYEVTKARDGYEALELVYRQTPDVIIMDLMMPQMNGFALMANVRTLTHGLMQRRKIPTIVLSALGDQVQTMERFPGVVGVMCKGQFNLEGLRKLLDRALMAA